MSPSKRYSYSNGASRAARMIAISAICVAATGLHAQTPPTPAATAKPASSSKTSAPPAVVTSKPPSVSLPAAPVAPVASATPVAGIVSNASPAPEIHADAGTNTTSTASSIVATEPAKPSGNVYQAIVLRNPFGLLPPPPPPSEDNTPPPPPPPPPISVRLSGLTDMMGKKKALLVLTEQGPNKPPKYVGLTEGEKSDGVEILSIDLKTKYVKIVNNGQMTNMTFAKLESGPSPVPGQPGMPGQPPGMPGGPPRIPGAPPTFPRANPAAGGGNASADASSGGSVVIGSSGGDSSARSGSIFTSSSGATGGYAPSGGGGYAGGTYGAASTSGGTYGAGSATYGRDPRTTPTSTTQRPNHAGMTPRFEIPHLDPPQIPGQTTSGQ